MSGIKNGDILLCAIKRSDIEIPFYMDCDEAVIYKSSSKSIANFICTNDSGDINCYLA